MLIRIGENRVQASARRRKRPGQRGARRVFVESDFSQTKGPAGQRGQDSVCFKLLANMQSVQATNLLRKAQNDCCIAQKRTPPKRGSSCRLRQGFSARGRKPESENYRPPIATSTRRLVALPSALSLLTSGLSDPYHCRTMRVRSIPCLSPR